jgi:hypothetical protein
MKTILLYGFCLLCAAAVPVSRGQQTPPAGTPTPFNNPVIALGEPSTNSDSETSTNESKLLDEVAAQKPHHDDRLEIDLGVDYRRPLGGDYDSLSLLNLSISKSLTDYDYLGLTLGAGALRLKSGSLADSVAEAPVFAEIGFIGRHYLTKPKMFLRPYLTASFSYAWMAWDYRRGSIPPDLTSSYYDLLGFDGYAGCGLAVRASKRLSFFGEIVGGGVALYDNNSEDHVNNTVFQNFGYLAAKAGFRFVF